MITDMKFYLLIDENKNALSKGICYIDLTKYEIEITEEQYNQINGFPLKLIFDENGKVTSWKKTEIKYEPIPEPPREPTTEERITALEEALNFVLGL